MFDWDRIKQRVKMARGVFIPLALYIGSLAGVMIWLDANPDSESTSLIALLPMIFVIWIAVSLFHLVGSLDELERKAITDGMAGSFALTLILLIGLVLLEAVGAVEVRSLYIMLFMIAIWIIGKLWGMRKFQ